MNIDMTQPNTVQAGCTNAAALAGRILLAILFIMSGFGKITGYDGTAQYMATKLPMVSVLLPLTILTELGGGILLAVGYKARWVGLALAGFTLLAGLLFHDYWNADAAHRMGQYINFWKNVSITGGMLMVFAFGPGAWSVDRK
ncbi:MAG TPA: DoxX family protein [Usitatibacter sp.]|nr:DoxX family protein [Usitatibacter sp.]